MTNENEAALKMITGALRDLSQISEEPYIKIKLQYLSEKMEKILTPKSSETQSGQGNITTFTERNDIY